MGTVKRPGPCSSERRDHVIVDDVECSGLDVGGDLELGEGREVNAIGLSKTEFGHGANPASHAVLVTKVVDKPGRTQAADVLELEIHNPTGLFANGLGGLFQGLGGLVEADRSADRFLKQLGYRRGPALSSAV